VLPFKQRDLLRKRVNSSNPFNLFTYPLEHPFIPTEPIQEKRKPTKEANKIQAPVSTPSYTNSRGEDLHLDTLQGHRKVTLQAPVSITPLTVEKVVCLVQMCPFSQKGWVEVSTISRFYCCLIVFPHLTCFFRIFKPAQLQCTDTLLGCLWNDGLVCIRLLINY